MHCTAHGYQTVHLLTLLRAFGHYLESSRKYVVEEIHTHLKANLTDCQTSDLLFLQYIQMVLSETISAQIDRYRIQRLTINVIHIRLQ